MRICVIFYEDPNPKDCNILGVYYYKEDAVKWLKSHGWYYNSGTFGWNNSSYGGFAEILEKDLQ